MSLHSKAEESWEQGRGAVLIRIEHLEGSVAKLDTKLDAIWMKLGKIDTAIAGLKVKSGAWGAIAGVVAVIAAYFMSKLGK